MQPDPNHYPPGWDHDRTMNVARHYERQSEDEMIAEDEAAFAAAAALPDGAPTRPSPKPWRPVAGLAERPSRMAFSDRLFYWFVYLGALALIAGGVCAVWFTPYHLLNRVGLLMIAGGVALFIFGGPDASAGKGYRS